jgi:hypothetical protein
VNEWEFLKHKAGLIPMLRPCITHLYGVMGAVHELENKKEIFSLLCLLVDTMDQDIVPHTDLLVEPLSAVWEAAAAEGTLDLRNCVMHLLAGLVQQLGPSSRAYHPLILHCLDAATDLARPEHVSLLEDGMALWEVRAASRRPGALDPRYRLTVMSRNTTDRVAGR